MQPIRGLAGLEHSIADLSTPIDSTRLAGEDDGIACVIGAGDAERGALPTSSRVRSLTPELVKGIGFDLVVLVDDQPPNVGRSRRD